MLRYRIPAVVVALVFPMACVQIATAQLQLTGTYYRADEAFPQYRAFWHEDSNMLDEEGDGKSDSPRPGDGPARPDPKLGASVHVFIRNTGAQAVAVTDVLVEGISLNEAIANSGQRKRKEFANIYFGKLAQPRLQKLVDAGEPVWWKVEPAQVPAGASGEVIVRIRQAPKSGAIALKLVTEQPDKAPIEARVPVEAAAPRIAGISFAAGLRDVYLYFRHPKGRGTAPVKILMDGNDITAACTISRDEAIALVPVVAKLDHSLTAGSYHTFAGTYADGSQAMAGIRAWRDDFAYGMFGGKSGKEDQPDIGRQYVDDLVAHNINVQMPQLGSAAVQAFLHDPAGRKYFADHGLRAVQQDVGKWGLSNPFALYVHDEPDCGDYKAKDIPENKKIGSMARWVIDRGNGFRAEAPAVPQMLNLDMTFKPNNWYTYGQIPDIFTVDPYYQARLKSAYTTHPERKPLYAKATYVYGVGVVAESSCEPRPLHVILNSVRHLNRQDRSKVDFRFATPQEKRIEVYYALAAGAKGLSYWWYTPGAPAYGVGAATSGKRDPEAAALWREIGLLGAEVRTAGPAILDSCPIELSVQSPKNVWTRFLAAGDSTVIMLAVNDGYRNDDKGTAYKPVLNIEMGVTLPVWMKSPQTFEVTAAGIKPIAARLDARTLQIPLGTIDIARMIVITTDTRLRTQMQSFYASKLARPTAALLTPTNR